MFKLQPEPRRTTLSLLGSFLFHGLLFTFLILWKPEVSQIFQEEKPKTVYLAKRVPSLKVPLPTPTRRLIPKAPIPKSEPPLQKAPERKEEAKVVKKDPPAEKKALKIPKVEVFPRKAQPKPPPEIVEAPKAKPPEQPPPIPKTLPKAEVKPPPQNPPLGKVQPPPPQRPLPPKGENPQPFTGMKGILVPDDARPGKGNGTEGKPAGPIKGLSDKAPGEEGRGGTFGLKGLTLLPPRPGTPKEGALRLPYGGKNVYGFGKNGGWGGGGDGWKNYSGAIAVDSHGINLDPWVLEVVRKIKRNWFVPQAALVGLQDYNCFYVVFRRNGTLQVFQLLRGSKIVSFNQSSQNAIYSSIRFPVFPSYYPFEDVKARVSFYYNLSPEEGSQEE